MIVLWFLILLAAVAYGCREAWKARSYRPPDPTAPVEKPGYVYFLENQNNPGRIKIMKQRQKLVTPLRTLAEFPTPTPNAALNQIYRDLEGVHLGSGWYDGDAVKMYLDHLKGVA